MARSTGSKSVREGSRWLENPPSAEELYEWIVANVKLPHPDLKHDDYLSGIVVIPNTEKIKRTVDGEIVDHERLSFSPYPQVDTRIRCFWDWMAAAGYQGKIKPIPSLSPSAQSKQLPAEVFSMTIAGAGDKSFTWLGATYQVEVIEPDGRGGRPVIEPPPGTKTVPLHGRFGPDVNAPMKAQTGAIGRALGFAGILILPGSGVASAEDMQELLGTSPEPVVPPVSAPESAPEVGAAPWSDPDEARRQIVELSGELETNYPATWTAVCAWAKERGLDLADPPVASLAPLVKQLGRKLAQAKQGASGNEAVTDAH